jgi:dihydroorotate dehydrogenase (fumarate)
MNLTTRYLGLQLKNPLIAGAGPLTGEIDNIRRLEHLGAAAIVLPSVFEEQIEQQQRAIEHLVTTSSDSYGEALSYFPKEVTDAIEPERYLDLVHAAVAAVDIPIIASLNGITAEGWVQYARRLQEAGVRAIELNIYFISTDLELSGAEVEQRYLDVLRAVKEAVRIPVAVKLGPYFSAMGDMARRLEQAGADGLVLFNRFYQPDIDLARLALTSDLELSRPYEIRLPLLWIGVLSGRLRASLAAGTGVDSAEEVIKYLLAGADVVMTTSALLRHGLEHMQALLEGLERWLGARNLEGVDAIRGLLRRTTQHDGGAFERTHYISTLHGRRLRS